MKRPWIILLIIIFTISACNFPLRKIAPSDGADEPKPSHTPTPTLLMTATATPIATDSQAPTETATPTPTPDQSPASMLSIGGDLLCRFGPGLRFGTGGILRASVSVLITARNGAGDWFQFELPGYPGKYCWVPANEVQTSGDLTLLAIAQAPLSFVTNVTVLLDPVVMEPTICVFPLTFNVTFTIETIGPAFVTFQRSQSTGLSAPPETVEFTEAGPMVFEDYLRADAAGEHWFQVAVSSPNSVVSQGVGTVVCP